MIQYWKNASFLSLVSAARLSPIPAIQVPADGVSGTGGVMLYSPHGTLELSRFWGLTCVLSRVADLGRDKWYGLIVSALVMLLCGKVVVHVL